MGAAHPRLTSSYTVGIVAATLLLVLGLFYARLRERLAYAEAASNFEQFCKEFETGRFLFLFDRPLLHPHPEERAEGLAMIHRAAGRFHVLERRDWSSASEYRMLPPEDQTKVRQGLVQSLLYLAGEEGELAAHAPDAEKAAHIAEALRLNDLARQCSASQNEQSVIRTQRSTWQVGTPPPRRTSNHPRARSPTTNSTWPPTDQRP